MEKQIHVKKDIEAAENLMLNLKLIKIECYVSLGHMIVLIKR